MKISKDVIAKTVSTIRVKIQPEILEEANVKAYYLDDMTASFAMGERETFFGLTVSVIGRDFHVMQDLSVLVQDEDEETNEEAVFIVEDPAIIEFLNGYLLLRGNLLETFGA